MSGPLELELQAAVSCPSWVLGHRLRSSPRADELLTIEPSVWSPVCVLKLNDFLCAALGVECGEYSHKGHTYERFRLFVLFPVMLR